MMKRIDNEQVFVVVISAGDFEVQPGEISLVNDSKQESVPATTTSPALQSKVAEEHVARGFVTFPRTTDEGDLTYALRIPHSINTGAFYTSDAGHSILQFDNTELDILKMVEKGLDEDEIRDRLGIDWDVSGSDVRRVADAAIAVLQILAK